MENKTLTKEERFEKWVKEHPRQWKKLQKLSPQREAQQRREKLREKKKKERSYIMAVLWKKGYTYQQIGEVFNLTHQRVQQLLKSQQN